MSTQHGSSNISCSYFVWETITPALIFYKILEKQETAEASSKKNHDKNVEHTNTDN